MKYLMMHKNCVAQKKTKNNPFRDPKKKDPNPNNWDPDWDFWGSIGQIFAIILAVVTLGFAIYTISVRSNPDADWSPVLPGYAAAMIVLCSIITLVNGKTLFPPAKDMAYALGHGAAFIVVGTKLFNRGSRSVPAVPMTVFAQTEMVFVPLWAFLVLGEAPKAATAVGGAIIFAAVVGKAILDTAPSLEDLFGPTTNAQVALAMFRPVAK